MDEGWIREWCARLPALASNVGQSIILLNLLGFVIGFQAALVRRWHDHVSLRRSWRGIVPNLVEAVAQALLGMMYLLSAIFGVVTLNPLLFLPLGTLVLGGFAGNWAWK